MTDNQADISETQMETIPKVGVTDAQRELANNAHVEFESRQYDRWEYNRAWILGEHVVDILCVVALVLTLKFESK